VAQGDWHSLKKRWLFHLVFSLLISTIFLYLLKPHFFADILGFKRIAKNNIGNVITADPKSAITPWLFFISQFKVILHYLTMFIWPFNISVEYDWLLCQHLFALDCLVPFIVLCGIAYATFFLFKRKNFSLLAFGIMWFFFCIAPRSSIIPSPELLVDYKTYTASIGWLFFIASCLVYGALFLIPFLEKRIHLLRHRHAKPVFIATSVLLLGFATINRNTVWRSGLEFWGNILQNAPNKARAYNNYAVELSQKLHKFEESIPYFKKAIVMDRNYPDPCNNLAVAYSQLGKIELAVEAMKMGLRINPYYPEGYNNLASFYVQQKKLDQAEKMLQNALKLRPYYGKAYFNLGRIYLEKGEVEHAWECFKKCCTVADLDNEIGFSMYAKASVLLKKFDDAIFAYKKLLEYVPNDTDAQFNLANAYSLTNQHTQALPLYEKLYQLTPQDHRIIYNMAEAHLRAGNPEKALELFSSLKPMEKQLPHLNIRLAACYEKMGEISTAIAVLKQLDNGTAPSEIRNSARELMKKLHAQYVV
jgi:tetratricopeptide (TPR) repeat protein